MLLKNLATEVVSVEIEKLCDVKSTPHCLAVDRSLGANSRASEGGKEIGVRSGATFRLAC
jgi:hypothetical protein